MVAALLVLYGAALFVNGFLLLGKVDPRAAAPVNATIGVIGILIGLHTGATGALGPASGFVTALLLIFAINFFIVGAMFIGALDSAAVGYYCVFGSIACLLWAIGFLNFGSRANATFSVIWAILFAMFAGNLAFKKDWARITAYATIFTAFATLLLPGYWLLIGQTLP